MKCLIAGLALILGTAPAFSQPSKEVTKTCIKTESTSPRIKYLEISANEVNETEDDETGKTETTIRFGQEEIGIWETKSNNGFGLVYKGKQIPLNQVSRLSKEMPVEFNPSLAMWGVVSEGSKSYICITFNFEGLGQSGSFQNVRGIYLLDRNARTPRPFYTVGRVTETDVMLAK